MNQMGVRIELSFNGDCAQAIALYERAFGIRAKYILRYKDAPPEDGSQHPAGTEDHVMHVGKDAACTTGRPTGRAVTLTGYRSPWDSTAPTPCERRLPL